jgi:hypothetical protein
MQIGEGVSEPLASPAPTSSEPEAQNQLRLELHGGWLPEGTILRVEGLAAPLELDAAACRRGADSYAFTLGPTTAGSPCRAVLVLDGAEHVVFEGVDLHAHADDLRASGSGDPPEPFTTTWPETVHDASAPDDDDDDDDLEPSSDSDPSEEELQYSARDDIPIAPTRSVVQVPWVPHDPESN